MPTSRPTVAYSFQGSRVWVNTWSTGVLGWGVLQTPRAKALGTEASEAAHLPPLLLLLLLCEDRVDPPDLGEHGAVAQAKAQTQEPEAGLGKERGQERTGRGNRWDCARMGQAVGGDR